MLLCCSLVLQQILGLLPARSGYSSGNPSRATLGESRTAAKHWPNASITREHGAHTQHDVDMATERLQGQVTIDSHAAVVRVGAATTATPTNRPTDRPFSSSVNIARLTRGPSQCRSIGETETILIGTERAKLTPYRTIVRHLSVSPVFSLATLLHAAAFCVPNDSFRSVSGGVQATVTTVTGPRGVLFVLFP